MTATIDVDIGGTFTDCLIVTDKQLAKGKAPTTRHDLSIGFRRAAEMAAGQLGLTLDGVLRQASMVRYSTTIAMNSVIERKGAKLGFITTAGHEHLLLIARSRSWADGLHIQERRHVYRQVKPDPLIPFDMTVGIRERIESNGKVFIPIQKEEVREKVRYLANKGARGFVVCLLWSFLNPVHEQVVKEVIEEEFPEIYLGSMPVMLSSEVQPKWHEYPRANVTILNAYMHQEMAEQLSTLSDELRKGGYRKPLLMINNKGGVAKLARTSAVDTYGAGPVAGLMGAAYLSQIYGFPKVIVSDMGGTSFDYGLVENGSPHFYQEWPVIDRWATERSMVEVNSIGAGGGSIAWINPTMGNRLEVGPQSAGADPGPACYDQGGKEAAVTDADVVLGYINPDYFLGGKIKLNAAKAFEAVEEKVAKPLGLTVVEAAAHIRKVIDAKMADVMYKEICLRGYSPSEFVLFAYGGAGPTHCVDYGGNLGVSNIFTSPYASVFCALGGAATDLRQIYEKSKHLVLYSPEKARPYLDDFEQFNSLVEELQKMAYRDILSEGFQKEQIVFELDLEMRYGVQFKLTRVTSPRLHIKDIAHVKRICDEFYKEYTKIYGEMPAAPEAGINIENFYLIASAPLRKVELPTFSPEGENPEKALKGARPVYWHHYGRYHETRVFDVDLLRSGNIILGPAIIEAKDTTYVIPPDAKCTVDKYTSLLIEKSNRRL